MNWLLQKLYIARNVTHPLKLTPKINFQNLEDEELKQETRNKNELFILHSSSTIGINLLPNKFNPKHLSWKIFSFPSFSLWAQRSGTDGFPPLVPFLPKGKKRDVFLGSSKFQIEPVSFYSSCFG